MMQHVFKNLALSIMATFAVGSGTSAFAQSVSGTGSLTLIRPLTITKTNDMVFGTIIRPATGGAAGTVSVTPAAAPVRAITGGVVVLGTGPVAESGAFTLDGEGGQVVSVGIPATFNMTSGVNTLTVTTIKTIGATVTLSNAIGAAGNNVFYVGGSVAITPTTLSGVYVGSYTVTASYN